MESTSEWAKKWLPSKGWSRRVRAKRHQWIIQIEVPYTPTYWIQVYSVRYGKVYLIIIYIIIGKLYR